MRPSSCVVAFAVGVSLGGGPGVTAAPPVVGEYQVKAAFLLHFTRYVEWPAQGFPAEGEPFVITLLGEDPFGDSLEAALQDRTVRERPLAIRRVARLEDVGRSQILFIGGSDSEDLPRILRRLDAAPTLTVGESPHFAEQGGMVRFRRDRDRVGFDINVASTERAGLRISSQLLKLARIVGQGRKG
jgi:hypothetical protein